MLTLALTLGMSIVIPEMTKTEAIIECMQMQDNPALKYKLIALDGDYIVGDVQLKGSSLAVVQNNQVIQIL